MFAVISWSTFVPLEFGALLHSVDGQRMKWAFHSKLAIHCLQGDAIPQFQSRILFLD